MKSNTDRERFLESVRTAVGDVQLGNQRPGSIRRLNRVEVGSLHTTVGL